MSIDGFFANALAKYDVINADVTAQTSGYRADADGDAFGVQGEIGYRFGSGYFFFEPVATLAWQQTSLDDFTSLGASIDYDDLNGLRGSAGMRVGGISGIGEGGRLTWHLGGHAVHEFAGEGEVTFTSGTSSVEFENDPIDTFGRIELGLNILSVRSVSGFIEASADMGSDYDAFTGRAGIRMPF